MTNQVNRESIDNQVYKIIKGMILTLELSPGVQINISQMAKRLGVSNTPIRSALSRLYQQGWLQHTPSIGYKVIQISEIDIIELYEIRKMIETASLRKIIENKNTDLLKTLLARCHKLKEINGENKKIDMFRELDVEIHRTIITSYHSEIMNKMLNSFLDIIKISQHMSPEIDQHIKDHIDILESILKKDLHGTKKLLIKHIDSAKKLALERFENKDKDILT